MFLKYEVKTAFSKYKYQFFDHDKFLDNIKIYRNYNFKEVTTLTFKNLASDI